MVRSGFNRYLQFSVFLLLASCLDAKAEKVGVYSGRHYNSDKELYKLFTKRTGISVNLLEAKDDALIERLKAEGKKSSADVLVLVDAARLDRAANLGLLGLLNRLSCCSKCLILIEIAAAVGLALPAA